MPIDKGLAVILLAAACVAVGYAGLSLTRDSLWFDEYWSLYYSGIDGTSGLPLWERRLEDVHPPGYYMLLGWALMLHDDPIVAGRAFSLAAGVVALVLTWLALPRGTASSARAFAVAFGAVSWAFFHYSLDMRAYPLGFAFVAALIFAARRVLEEDASWRSLILPSALTILGTLCLFYIGLAAGGVFLALFVLSRSTGAPLRVALAGAAGLIPPTVWAFAQRQFMRESFEEHWIEPTFHHVFESLRYGLAEVAGSAQGLLLLAVLPAAAAIFAIRGGTLSDMRFVALLMLAPVAACLCAILLTLAGVPVFSSRTVVTFAPFVWILAGLSFHTIVARGSGGMLIGAISALLLVTAVERFWLIGDHALHAEYRDSATFIGTLDRCAGAVLPVVVHAHHVPAAFHDHYLPKSHRGRYLPVPARPSNRDDYEPLIDLASRRIAGADACPVLLWSVYFYDKDGIETLTASLERALGLPEGKRIAIEHFAHAAANPFSRTALSEAIYASVVVVRSPSAEPLAKHLIQ